MPARDAQGRFVKGSGVSLSGGGASGGAAISLKLTKLETAGFKKVEQAAEKAAFRNFAHAAASISKDVKSTLEKAEGPSDPGKPPHTHRGAYLRRAVRFAADKEGAVIGPMASVVDEAGALHEFGESRGGVDFPERPFMGPALERAIPRFAGEWRGSIGQ